MDKIFKKADEMEMAINMKAVRNAYAFLTVTVLMYCFWVLIKTGELPFVFLFSCISGVIFWMTKLIETDRLTKQSEEDEE